MPKTKEEIRAAKRLWYQTHPEAVARYTETLRKKRKANPTFYAEQQQKYDKNRKKGNIERGKEYYAKNKTKVLESLRDKLLCLRTEFVLSYGGVCVCCGESDPRFLTLDHVAGNGAGRDHRRSLGKRVSSGAILKDLKRRGWPQAGYQLLCFNCNCGRARNGGICPHKDSLSA